MTGVDYPGKKGDTSRATCVSCHGVEAHENNQRLNDHTDKIACQTCHIPLLARGDYASKMWWDWSTAGKMGEDGKPMSVVDEFDHEIYNSKKGDFTWERDVVPEYRWYNGNTLYTLPGEAFDPSGVVEVNKLLGSAADGDSLIWPIKLMRGKQPYDSVNNSFVTPHTTGKDGYWKTFDWPSAIEKGMAAAGIPYSGEYDFIETEMSWPITHMTAPASEALKCIDCHTSAAQSRMASITDVYIPGRDSNDLVDKGGLAILILTLIGVIGHGLVRVFFRSNKQ
jgi:hypothetical protein